jgi:hypothetical protein
LGPYSIVFKFKDTYRPDQPSVSRCSSWSTGSTTSPVRKKAGTTALVLASSTFRSASYPGTPPKRSDVCRLRTPKGCQISSRTPCQPS